MEVDRLHGDEAQKFIAWLTMVKGFLPESMPISEAMQIFIRKRDDEKAKEQAAG